MVLLGNSNVPGALVFSERFRKRLAQTEVIFEGKRIPITASLGTATFDEAWHTGLNPEKWVKELIHRADTALYYSKANGRNQTSQFENLPEEALKKAG